MSATKLFPVLNAPEGCVKFIPWFCINGEHAMKLHSQTVERLAERGGLCPYEIYLNFYKLGATSKVDMARCISFVNWLAEQKEN